MYLQFSSNTGPAECCLAVANLLRIFVSEADKTGIKTRVVEKVDGPYANTLRSVLLELTSSDNDHATQLLAEAWQGSLLWICASPYRPAHKRKNWFIGCRIFAPACEIPDSEIRYETTRASGPGGQHVNKTDSAVRATHISTGLSVKVQTERSQLANKRLALQLLDNKLMVLNETMERDSKAERRMQHHETERGNAKRVFTGLNFKESKRSR